MPWTLGSLVASAIVSALNFPLKLPNLARDIARPVIGVLAGGAITIELLMGIAALWPAIVVVLIYTLAITVLGYGFFRYLGRFDPVTAYFAVMPAGLGELTLLGGSMGANSQQLVVVHFVRIVAVVFLVPFFFMLFGESISGTAANQTAVPVLEWRDWVVLGLCAGLGFAFNRLAPIPGGVMLYPLILSALANITGLTDATPPNWLIIVVQVVIGCVIGGRFAGINWQQTRRTMLVAIVWASLLVPSVYLVAGLAGLIIQIDMRTLVLAMAPGGMVEMTVLSLALSGSTAFVVVCQTFRIVLVIVLAPLLFARLNTRLP